MENEKDVLNLTFIIGNGFDINLGLKTRYADFVEVYKEPQEGDSEEVIIMKNMLSKDDYNWCDLEEKLGEYTNNFDDGIKFCNAHNDMGEKLCDYLKKEELKVDKFLQVSDELCIYFMTSIETAINNYVDEVYKNDEIMRKKHIVVNFIIFNYTNIIDSIVAKISNNKYILEKKYDNYSFGKIIHCHGSLGGQICFGVDNETQIINKKIFENISKRYKQELIKPEYNKIYNNINYMYGIEIINSSDCVVAYGCSFGNTDKEWIRVISDWLARGEGIYKSNIIALHHKKQLTISSHRKPDNSFFQTTVKVFEDEIKNKFTFDDDEWIKIVYDNMFIAIENCIKD